MNNSADPERTVVGEGFERLHSVVREWTESGRIVGAVVLVRAGGELRYAEAAGFADKAKSKAVRLGTLFRWSSLTKAVSAVATLALVERERIHLDDPVIKILPEFRPRLADGSQPVITVRHLLTHTAGLTYAMLEPPGGPYHQARVSDGLDQPGLSADENLRRIASVPLSFAPGTQWRYSVAYDVLGLLLERATGKPLPELWKHLVTAPLGMIDTDFRVVDPARLATPYWITPSGAAPMGAHQDVPFAGGAISFAPGRVFDSASYPSAGAGLVGTASDFMRLLEAVRNGGSPVLSPRTVELLSTISTGSLRTFVPGWGWSLGWSVLADPSQTKTPQATGTWQWGGVYGCSWFVDPSRELSVVVLTNTAVAGMLGPFPDALRDAIYETQGENVPAPAE